MMRIKNILEAKNRYKMAYKNYTSVMWNVWRKKDKIKVILQNGNLSYLNWELVWDYSHFYSQLIKNKNIYDLYFLDNNNVKFIYKEKNIILKGIGDINCVFINEEYSFLNVKNEIVVDIGANIGDTPIYFALNNAKKVIALEPYPYAYKIALKNIRQNNMEDKIILLNAGYGKDDVVKVDSDFKNTTGSDLKLFNNGVDIRIISLKTLLYEYQIDKALLKMDCEGCEYYLLNEDNDILKKFKRIQIEYHYGYEKLKEKLKECGFTVTYSKPRKSYNKNATNPNMDIGFIYAKIDS